MVPYHHQWGQLQKATGVAATLWRLSVRRQPSAGAAWLAEPRFPTRVYGYDPTALPLFILQRTCRLATAETSGSTIGSSDHQGPAWLHEIPDSSADPQTGQFGRSEAEAKLHRWRLDQDPETTEASCEAIRGHDHGSLGLALPARPRSLRSLAMASARSL